MNKIFLNLYMRPSPFDPNYQRPQNQPPPVQMYPPTHQQPMMSYPYNPNTQPPPNVMHHPVVHQNPNPYHQPPNYQQPKGYEHPQQHPPQHQHYQPEQPQQYEQAMHPHMMAGNGQEEGYDYGEQQYEYQEGQNSQEDSQDIHNQQIILFWEHKFYTIHERFQWVHDKVQWMRTQFYNLNNQLKAVDSEAEWNDAKEHHEDYIQQLEEFSQELTGVLNENQNLLEQREIEGEENGVWKQRYYQLFQGFKVMEQELNEYKENRVGGNEEKEEEDEKYQEFVESYRELEREYTNVVNELQQYKRKEPVSDEVKEYRSKLEYALNQAEKFKKVLDQLHEENEYLQGTIEQLKEENNNLQNNVPQGNNSELEYQLNNYAQMLQEREADMEKMHAEMQEIHMNYENQMRKNQASQGLSIELENKSRQIQMLKANLLEIKAQNKSASSVSEEYQRILKIKTQELEQKGEEVNRLRKDLAERINIQRNETSRESLKKDYDNRIQKLQNQYQDRILELKKRIKKKEEQAQISALTAIKLQSYEKRVKLLSQELNNLTENLEEKQKQNSELKRSSYEAEKLRGIEVQYNVLLEERDSLNGALLQKNYDIDNLQSQINQFELRIREINDKNVNSQSKVLMNEIEELNEIIRSKDGDLTKLKSSLGLKESYIEELQSEIQSQKNSLASMQKHYENEKEISNQKIALLERKNLDSQKKMRQLQYEFGVNMIKNLEEQIRSLRVQNQAKQETIIRMQGEELELRSRISHHERIRNSHDADVQALSTRIRELENSKNELLRKMEASFREVKNKQRQIKDYIDSQISLKQSFKNSQILNEQSENLIKQKNKIIQQLQEQLSMANTKLKYVTDEYDNLRLRRRDETDIFMKQSDQLKRKIFQYETNSGSQKELQAKHQESLGKIENKIIKQLQDENDILKNELATVMEGLKVSGVKKEKKSKGSEGINYIQRRLFDFNSKLDEMILQNRELNENSSIHNRSLSSSRNDEKNWNGTFKNNQNQSEQIQMLKNQLNELRKYCAKLEVQAAGQVIQPNPKNSMVFMEQQKMFTDQVEFYKEKNSELQQRIDNLIQVNNNLRNRLEGLLRGEQEPSSITYYREQLANAEETIENLNKKIKKIMEQNRSLKLNNNDSTTKLCRNYEDKLFECENKIFGLERKITNLELEKIKSENEKANINRTMKSYESEVETIKNTLQKKLTKAQTTNDTLASELRSSESEVADMLQKIRLLQSENSRLSQAVHSTYSQHNTFINSPRSSKKINII